MKVGFDGIVLGSLAAQSAFKQRRLQPPAQPHAVRMLDVGCGCGIVALILRQAADRARVPVAEVLAIDIDTDAASQARENVRRSPWPHDVHVLHTSLKAFVCSSSPSPSSSASSTSGNALVNANGPCSYSGVRPPGAASVFDLIVCNPPYYARPRAGRRGGGTSLALSAADWPANRAHARFSEYLPAHELMSAAASLLEPSSNSSSFWCIYPLSEERRVRACAALAGLQCRRRVTVRFQAGHAVKRVVLEWGLANNSLLEETAAQHDQGKYETEEEELVVRQAQGGGFTPEFIALASECYSNDLGSYSSGIPSPSG